MYSNLIENINLIISSSMFHMLIVVAVIYFIYEKVLLKENENVITNEAVNAIDVFFNNLTNNMSTIPIMGQLLSKSELKKMFGSSFPITSTATLAEIDKINQENIVYNKPILNRLNNYFIIFGSLTLGFIVIYNLGFYKKISYRHAFTEIFFSTLISFSLIALYEYLFVYKFVFKYIDYHLYNFFNNKLFYVPEYQSVYQYNNNTLNLTNLNTMFLLGNLTPQQQQIFAQQQFFAQQQQLIK